MTPRKVLPMRRSLLTATLLGAAAIAPSAAAAATVTVPPGCHTPTVQDPKTIAIPYTVTGLTPGAQASASVTAQGFLDAPSSPLAFTADAAGNAAGTVSIPAPTGLKPFPDVPATLTIADAAGGVLAQSPVTVDNVGFEIGNGKVTSLKKKIEWQVSGLNAISGGNATYYAFYFKAKDAKKKKLKVYDKMKLGTGTGTCGYLKAKRPLAPFSTSGAFVVAIVAGKKFDPDAPGLVGAVKIAKTKKKL